MLVLAVTVHTVSAAPSPTCLGLASDATVGWKNSTRILDYVPPAFLSNCGYLSLVASTSCNQNCTNPRACCGAVCGWNGAGCGCLGGQFSKFMKTIPMDGAEPLTPAQLSQSTCQLGTVYSGSNCKSLSASGSNTCKRAKPPTEDAACSTKYQSSRTTILTSLMKMVTFPASFNVTSKNVGSQLEALVSKNAVMAVGEGLTFKTPLNIAGRSINPKLALKNANLLRATVNRGSTDATGRYMLAAYNIHVKDIKGVNHNLGTLWASVTFSPCSNAIESIYMPKELTTNQVNSFIETFPKVSKVTTSKSAQNGRRLMEVCASAAAAGPQSAAGWMASAVHTVAPYLPFVQYDPTRRSLAEKEEMKSASAGVTATGTTSTIPLEAASRATRNQNTTLASLGDGLVNGTNTILNSPAMQNATYNFSNSTFVCPGSTLDNMQFCDGWSGSSTYDMSDTGIVSGTCTGLCADGAWDAMSGFTCDYGCASAMEASCQSCQSGCSASCSTCKSGCSAGCSTCQARVTAACGSCQVACCYGCQTCIPGVPASCVNAQWCSCSSTCDQSQCNGACNCDSACGSVCNYTCPDCTLNCQDSCEDGLGSVGMEYSYSANLILGMGALNMSGISSSQTVTTYTANQTNPSAQFGANMSWDYLQVKVGFSATVTPSYGAPVIPWTYITTTISQSTYNTYKSTFVTIQDCIPSSANNYKPTGKLSVSMTDFELNTNWVPWQDVYDVLEPWTAIFGTAWVQDAAQAMVGPIDDLLNNQAAPLVFNLMNPQLAAYNWGTYTCG